MELLLKSSAPLCRCFFPPQNGENEAVIQDMSEWHAAIGAEKDDRLHRAALHCEGCDHEALLSSTVDLHMYIYLRSIPAHSQLADVRAR